MKKNAFLLLLSIGFLNTGYSQPVINRSNFTSHYAATVYKSNDIFLSAGLAGPNRTWDFSSAVLDAVHTEEVVPIVTAAFVSSFPTANYCYEYNVYNVSGNTNYLLYNLNDNAMEIIGETAENLILNDWTPNPELVFSFPYTYNTIFTDQYEFTTDTAPRSVTKTYDAYGTLITPFGTYTNVIRCKIQRTNPSYLAYEWYHVDPVYDLAFMQEDGRLLVYGNQVLSTVEHAQNLFSIYPNPTSNDFIINANGILESNQSVCVIDILGNTIVKKQTIHNNPYSVSLDGFSSGLYFVKIFDQNNNLLQTVKMIKK